MADEPTLGEVVRRLDRLEIAESLARQSLINDLSQRVRADVFELVRKGLQDDITEVRTQLGDVAQASRRRRGEVLAWLSLAVAMIAVLVTIVYAQSQGAR